MNYTGEELVNMVYAVGESNRNCLLASRIYAAKYPAARHPDERVFKRLRDRFEASNSTSYRKRRRTSTATHEENEFLVLGSLIENPHVSVRQLEHAIDLNKSSVWRIIQRHKFHPYHVQLVQELDENDFLSRLNFCQWANNKILENPYFFNNVLFSDEATFHRNGYVNRHNYHYYATENSNFIRPTYYQHRWSLNVWAGILGNRILGPYFFERNITAESYLEFLRTDLEEYFDNFPLNLLERIWLQQDGASPHYSIAVRAYLDERFPEKWIGRGGPVAWPARSPDLTKLDFFLWGFIKEKVYKTSPTTKEDMKVRIRNAIQSIDENMLGRVNSSFTKRIHACIRQNGAYIENDL